MATAFPKSFFERFSKLFSKLVANLLPDNSDEYHAFDAATPNKYRMRAAFWMTGAVVLFIFMIILWMFSKTGDIEKDKAEAESANVDSVREVQMSNKIEELQGLSYVVKPIQFETIVRDLRSYPEEFKDHRYLSRRKGKWALQVMDVEEYKVIGDYLDSREDREKFAYFRYTNENKNQRYILVYDTFTTAEEALDIQQTIDFNLPKTVNIAPEEINRYLKMIDNYERAEEVHDMSGSRPRDVVLKKTGNELPVRSASRPKPKPKPQPVLKTEQAVRLNNSWSSNQTSRTASTYQQPARKTQQNTVKSTKPITQPKPTSNSNQFASTAASAPNASQEISIEDVFSPIPDEPTYEDGVEFVDDVQFSEEPAQFVPAYD